ncbi:hypothetical protein L1987_45496 [Smallanthus sonchifolius]|uniref:Uncharacterized protein n=1 Tax=Smallanthus sonchifolius TaxID=185202 RepID=A0ACB9FX82_9ASTR|nr:hypothetical protein L1987_45496 [Smallanthus sonchifolius]
MSTITRKEDDAVIQGQARFFDNLYSGISGAALRCALELNIAGIIKGHDGPITLSQIAQGISSPTLNVEGLSRLMRLLVLKQIFDEVHQPEREEPLYALNQCSKYLVQDTRDTLAPIARFFTDPLNFSPFYNLNLSIKEGGTAALKTYGVEVWDLFSHNPQANKSFNDSMASLTRINMDAVMSSYDFGSLEGTLLDVGGGVGVAISEIVNTYPHLKGINFDMPHVISSAPSYEGVTHVGGDMFTTIPRADSFMIKELMPLSNPHFSFAATSTTLLLGAFLGE